MALLVYWTINHPIREATSQDPIPVVNNVGSAEIPKASLSPKLRHLLLPLEGRESLRLPPLRLKSDEQSNSQPKRVAEGGSASRIKKNNLKPQKDPKKPIQPPPPIQLHCRWPDCGGSQSEGFQHADAEELMRHIAEHVKCYKNEVRTHDLPGKKLSCLWGSRQSGNRCEPMEMEEMLGHMEHHVLRQQQGKDVPPTFQQAFFLPTNIVEEWKCSNGDSGVQGASGSGVLHFCPGCNKSYTRKTSLDKHFRKVRSFKCSYCNGKIDGTARSHKCQSSGSLL